MLLTIPYCDAVSSMIVGWSSRAPLIEGHASQSMTFRTPMLWSTFILIASLRSQRDSTLAEVATGIDLLSVRPPAEVSSEWEGGEKRSMRSV